MELCEVFGLELGNRVNKPKILILATLLAALAMVPFILQHGSLNQLRAENDRLRAQVQELTETLQSVSVKAASTNSAAGSSLSREQFAELMRLRGEVTALRRATNSVASAGAARNLASVSPPAVGASAPAPLPEALLTTNAPPWNNVGYARPADAMSSLIWTMQQGRMDLLLGAATPEAQQELQRGFASTSNSVERIQAEAAKIVEVRPSALYPSNDREAYMTMVIDEPAKQLVLEENAQVGNQALAAGTPYTQAAQKIETTVKLQKVGNDWRYAGRVDARASK